MKWFPNLRKALSHAQTRAIQTKEFHMRLRKATPRNSSRPDPLETSPAIKLKTCSAQTQHMQAIIQPWIHIYIYIQIYREREKEKKEKGSERKRTRERERERERGRDT